MKNVMLGVATILIYLIIITTTFDSKMFIMQANELGYVAQELSATGTLFLDFEDYADGNLGLHDEQAMLAIEDQIKTLMRLDDNFQPKENSYWQDQVNFRVHFYDDKGLRAYQRGADDLKQEYSKEQLLAMTGHTEGTYYEHYKHNEYDDVLGSYERELSNNQGYRKNIEQPTVIVSINAGKPHFRLDNFQSKFNDKYVVRTSSHVWHRYGGEID